MVHHRVITKKIIWDEPVFYQKYDLFPEEVIQSESGEVLYFCPIFFSGRELGYFIIQYDHPDCYDIIFRDWLKIAANALEFLRMKNDIGTLLECRNLSELHDSITGLYNEQGLKNELKYPLRHADEGDTALLLLVRTELFFDSSSLELQELSVHMDMEQAEHLRKIAVFKDMFCAKLADKLYAVAAVGSYQESYAQLLADRLRALICHAPLYGKHCSADSLIICTLCKPAAQFQLDAAIMELSEQLSEKTAALIVQHQRRDCKEYSALRDMLFRRPYETWDVQKSCREFRLSSGHFRAIYKELFGISFHQDVIRSRIELAKYLLLTTALSMPAIAEKCGYEDDKYFLRQFRQLTGMTPNIYKNHDYLPE